MWNREFESQNHRQRRVSLIQKGMSHSEIDSVFEKEEMKQIVQESFQTTKEELLEKIDLEIEKMRQRDEIVFEEIQELLAKNFKNEEKFHKVLEGWKNNNKRDEERAIKRDEELNRIFKGLDEAIEEWKENNEKINKLRDFLNEKIKEANLQKELFIKEREKTNKAYIEYVKETELANETITEHNKKLDKLNRLITRYNNELRRLRG